MRRLFTSLFVILLLVTSVSAQQRTVTGIVKGKDDGLELLGVNIKIKGSTSVTQSGLKGQYSIRIPGDNAVLVFTYIGYTTQEVVVGKRSVVNVSMSPDAKSLGEVIVTGYGTTTKIRQVGSSAKVAAKDLEQTPFSSVDRALQGKVAGLQSSGASGQPGALQQIRIRGVGSISGSSSPLFVIDGVPVNSGDLSRVSTSSNALAGINPNDIENITVLKDAASTAIYGSRGANGVIIITTKSGMAGKTKLRLDADYGIVTPGRLNENTRPLNTTETLDLLGEALLNNPSYVSKYNLTESNVRSFLTSAHGFGIDSTINTDWYDLVTRRGKQQQYNLSMDGGNDKTKFHLGGGYFHQDGTIPSSSFTRYSGSVNLSHQVSGQFKVGTNIMLSTANMKGLLNSSNYGNPVYASFSLLPYLAARNADGTPNVSGGLSQNAGIFNPLYILGQDKLINNTQKALGSVFGEYKILKNLKLSSKFGIDYNNIEEDEYKNPFYGDGYTNGGYAGRSYTRYFNWVWTNLLDYHFDFAGDFASNIKLGYEAQKSQYYSATAVVYNMPLNTDYTVPSNGATPVTASGSQEDYAFASMFAIGDIAYKNRYVLSASFRRDGSSRFGPDRLYGNFWSVGGSWNVDQEEFIRNLHFFNSLKLRSSYGVTGNAGIGNAAWRTLYGYTRYGYNFVYDGQIGSGPSQYGLRNLTWEKTHTFDIGIDASLLKERLSLNIDFYNRQSNALLANVAVPLTTGFSGYVANLAGMRNRGLELAISGSPVKTKDFSWDLNFNFATNSNKVTKLFADNQVSSPFLRTVGENYWSYYLPVWAGADPQTGAPSWYVDGTRQKTTTVYSQAKRELVGKSPMPKGFGSFGTSLHYKAVSLDAMFYYSYGNSIFQGMFGFQNSSGAYYGSRNQSKLELDHWRKPGDINDNPVPVYGQGRNAANTSTRMLRDGDFVRLRDITLSYNVPAALLTHMKLSSVKVYARGSNLWTWTKDKNLPFDPEAGSSAVGGGTEGVSNFDVFIPKTFTLGLNVSF